MVERIDAEVTETLYALDARYRRAEDFRSVDTGYSFWDLCDQFLLIQKIFHICLRYLVVQSVHFIQNRTNFLLNFLFRAVFKNVLLQYSDYQSAGNERTVRTR